MIIIIMNARIFQLSRVIETIFVPSNKKIPNHFLEQQDLGTSHQTNEIE